MAINISPEEEAAILRVAARIRGARGGKAKTQKKRRASRINGKLRMQASAVILKAA